MEKRPGAAQGFLWGSVFWNSFITQKQKSIWGLATCKGQNNDIEWLLGKAAKLILRLKNQVNETGVLMLMISIQFHRLSWGIILINV
jgi:hypothetical protein